MNHGHHAGSSPRIAISVVTTYCAPIEDDIAAYAAAGAAGIGLWEFKVAPGRDSEVLERLHQSGLTATLCCPEVFSVLPQPHFPEPADPRERVRKMCAGIERLKRFEPLAVLCVTGDPAGLENRAARRTVVEGLREAGEFAGERGMVLGLEPYRRSSGSLVNTLAETAELVADIGLPNVKLIADLWHLWDLPTVSEDLRTWAPEIIGVQVSDYRDPPRGPSDRLLPGDGVIDFRSLFHVLDDAGYAGWYEVEVFSDNGVWENEYPDSLWDRDVAEVAESAVRQTRALWDSR